MKVSFHSTQIDTSTKEMSSFFQILGNPKIKNPLLTQVPGKSSLILSFFFFFLNYYCYYLIFFNLLLNYDRNEI